MSWTSIGLFSVGPAEERAEPEAKALNPVDPHSSSHGVVTEKKTRKIQILVR